MNFNFYVVIIFKVRQYRMGQVFYSLLPRLELAVLEVLIQTISAETFKKCMITVHSLNIIFYFVDILVL
jgi:hypothetical protein